MCDERAGRDAFHPPAEPEDEQGAGRDVDDVLRNGHVERDACVLHPDEPSGETVEPQHRRRAPDEDFEVAPRQRLDGGRTADEAEGHAGERAVEGDEQGGDDEGHEE